MYALGILFIGLIIGLVAKLLTPGEDPGGLIITVLLGIAGSFLAHYVGTAFGFYLEGEPAEFFVSVGGAVALLLLYRLIFRRGRW